MPNQDAFRSIVWRRLKKNMPAMISCWFIVLSVFVACFAYVLMPDGSPNADRQTVELQAKKPGHKQLFFRQPLPNKQGKDGMWQQLCCGLPDKYVYLPIQDYKVTGDQIQLSIPIDEDSAAIQLLRVNDIASGKTEPLAQHFITRTYWLGTDALGRDMLSRLILGTRISLTVGLLAALLSLVIGTFLGALAGYYRGFTDRVVMWILNVTWSIPTILLVFACTVALGKGFWQIFLAMGLTMWVNVARMVRGQVLVIRELEYVQAAKSMGFSDSRILIKHILPNLMGPLLVLAASNFATAIMLEAGLSFLGLGIQPPHPSWGLMMRENYHFIITNQPVLALVPGVAIFLLVVSFNLLANGLRDAVEG